MKKWYMENGEQSQVVLSTRIRLARNLADYPFPARMNDHQRKEVNEKIRDALVNSNTSFSEGFDYIEMDSVSELYAKSLVERRLISPDFARMRNGRALLLQKDESISIMLGEEDHMRIQVMRPGMALKEAADFADKLDTLLDSGLRLAFHETLGYLTQCPTNLGTGLRASLMLHLPALEQNGALSRMSSAVSKIGLTIRGAYGEGTEAEGSLYQLSNQVTLGISEDGACENLQKVAEQIIKEELAARELLRGIETEDSVWRALGILQNARKATHSELYSLSSLVRLGIEMGYIDHISLDDINAVLIETSPAMLQISQNKALTPLERDMARAEKLREIFANSTK